MILGVGVDIIRIDRIRKAIERSGENFIKRIFTSEEESYCLQMKDRFQHLAVRFAAKEAVLKAFGLSWDSVDWKDIGVINDKNGQPEVVLHNRMKNEMRNRGVNNISLSLSHFGEYAIAFVILERTEGEIVNE